MRMLLYIHVNIKYSVIYRFAIKPVPVLSILASLAIYLTTFMILIDIRYRTGIMKFFSSVNLQSYVDAVTTKNSVRPLFWVRMRHY